MDGNLPSKRWARAEVVAGWSLGPGPVSIIYWLRISRRALLISLLKPCCSTRKADEGTSGLESQSSCVKRLRLSWGHPAKDIPGYCTLLAHPARIRGTGCGGYRRTLRATHLLPNKNVTTVCLVGFEPTDAQPDYRVKRHHRDVVALSHRLRYSRSAVVAKFPSGNYHFRPPTGTFTCYPPHETLRHRHRPRLTA